MVQVWETGIVHSAVLKLWSPLFPLSKFWKPSPFPFRTVVGQDAAGLVHLPFFNGRTWASSLPFCKVHILSWGPTVYCGPAQADPVGGNSGRASSGQDRFPVAWTGLKNGRNISASKQEPESFQYQGKQEGGIWKLSDNPVERLERPHQRITVKLPPLTFFSPWRKVGT